MQDVTVKIIANNHPHGAELTLMETPLTEREVGQFKELLERQLSILTATVRARTEELIRQHKDTVAEYRRGHIDGFAAGIKSERVR